MTTLPRPTTELSADEARRIALRAQGLLGAPDRRAGVRGVLRHLGAVQLDTISVLARSHELIPYARLGAVGRRTVEEAYWKQGDRPAHTFEYWSHAACILPVEEWPHFAFRRRAYLARPHWNHELPDGVYDQVVKQLRVEGPLTATELGGAKRTSEWWDWSGTKVAVERALMYGEVVCVERRGWKRVYDLAERAVPASLLAEEPTDEECLRRLVGLAGRALGVGTRADIADYHRLKGEQVDAVIADSGLVPVTVAGWSKPAWADPEALASPAARPAPHDAAVPVRLPGLGAGAHGADLRLHPPPGGVRPQAQAGPRLLRDAGAGGRASGGPGGPGARGAHAGRQAGHAGRAQGGAAGGAGAGGGGGLGGLHGRPGGAGGRAGAAGAAHDGAGPAARLSAHLSATG